MRTIIGAVALVLGLATQPAFAREGAAPAGAAPLLTVPPISVAPTTILEALPVVAPPTPVPANAMFRLAPLSMPAIGASPAIATTDLSGGFRHRFTGNMMEYYPVAGSGFHLSGGSRLFQRRNVAVETGDSARGALSVTRVTSQSAVTRAGFRRFNPVATAGYTIPLSSMTQIGVEAGAMMGRAFAGTPGIGRHNAAFRGENGFHPDAIANLVFGMHF